MEKAITYSPAYTLVPTYECFNYCTYCNFRANLGERPWLDLTEASQQLDSLKYQGITEILILSGEVHPLSSRRKAWFQRIYDLCELALNKGFLPHTNAGILTLEEMKQLKEVNVSMGLMLEQLTPKLLQTVHKQAPSKVPQLRSQQLEWAGELGIPFTTGLLLGIGENDSDRIETLEAIASIQKRFGHIQEVILQPHSLGEKQSFSGEGFNINQLPEIITNARQILPSTITIQIPPNLMPNEQLLLECLAAGARDLGGIVPKDEVNPNYTHLDYQTLLKVIASEGWELKPRLPVYPQYYDWLPIRLQEAIKKTNRHFW